MSENTCNLSDVRPIMLPMAYPKIQVSEKNQEYANLLSLNYCGQVSEMSAIAQYINNENRLSCERCAQAKFILGIAQAEMIHLQKLGEMIDLLGGTIDYVAKGRDGRCQMWTPQFLRLFEEPREMFLAGIESEKSAIRQYEMHMRIINDNYVNAVLARIIKDEEYHILILQMLLNEV